MSTSDILGGLDFTNPVIQKSLPLLSLWQSPLTLSEFKILDAYLAHIDLSHPEKRWVRLSKRELETLLGVKKINNSDLLKWVDKIAVMVQVYNPCVPDGLDKIMLFERVVCKKTEEGWHIDLCCTASAMEHVFCRENLDYFRYKLRSIANLSSRYSYLMLLYLECNRSRGKWDVDLSDLREFLGCAGGVYPEYRYFNQFVLRKSQMELEKKTDCRFTYKPIKRGRRVFRLHFDMEFGS